MLLALVVLLVVAIGGGALLAQQAGLLPGSATAVPSNSDGEGTAGDAALTPPDEGDIPAIEEREPLTGRIVTAKPGKHVTAKVAVAGGSITAGAMTIDFPADALTGAATVSVTPAAIEGLGSKADFGGAVQPATPLYAVELGDVELLAPVAVTMTLDMTSAPEGAVPMAFSYDADAGMLTPLSPVSAEGGTLVSLATHFSPVLGAFVIPGLLPDFADSGFRPGTDDWQTGNWGSYVAPGGQCEGITTSEIWYYVYQRKAAGAAPLFGLYDNNGAATKTPRFWVDDADAYRFTGTAQAEPIADRAPYLTQRHAGLNAADGRMTYTAFRAAIAFTGQPQLIQITDATKKGGHAMTVYGVTPNWLLIADPNYPGVGRRIRFDPATGKLGPFSSAGNAADIAAGKSVSYVHFAYVHWQLANSAAWFKASWAALEAGTAGDGTFPAARLQYATGEVDADGNDVWADLGPSLTTNLAVLRVNVNPDDALAVLTYRVISYSGTRKQHSSQGTDVDVDLAEGPNDVGILVEGFVENKWRYVDFVRTVVTRGDQPPPSAAEGGRWVLTGSEAGEPFPSPFTSEDESLSLTIGNGSYSMTYTAGSTSKVTAELSWSPPPSSAAAGEVWSGSVSGTITCSETSSPSHFKGGVSAYLVGGNQDSLPAPSGETSVALGCSGSTTGNAAFTWAFPSESLCDGARLDVQATWTGESDGGYTYHYTWQP